MAHVTQRHQRVEPNWEKRNVARPQPVQTKPSRLRTLLLLLAVTTVLLIAHQAWRLHRRSAPRAPLPSSRPADMPLTSSDHIHQDASLVQPDDPTVPVQFDENGEMDLATMQRMLDILYKGPRDPEGYQSLDTKNQGEYRFRKDQASKQK